MKTETKRVKIREFEQSDVFAIKEYGQNEAVYRYTDWGPNTEESSKEFVACNIKNQNKEERDSYELIIENKEDEAFMGVCGLCITSKSNREAWISYGFKEEYWGKGYGTEVAKAMLDFGFRTLKLHRIFAICHVENKGSEHVLQKIGMQKEGILRKNAWCRTYWRDSYQYAILEEEYFVEK